MLTMSKCALWVGLAEDPDLSILRQAKPFSHNFPDDAVNCEFLSATVDTYRSKSRLYNDYAVARSGKAARYGGSVASTNSHLMLWLISISR